MKRVRERVRRERVKEGKQMVEWKSSDALLTDRRSVTCLGCVRMTICLETPWQSEEGTCDGQTPSAIRTIVRALTLATLTMHVLDLSPVKESRSTCVSLLARKGRCKTLRPRARMHSFNANSDLLISAPSRRVRRSDEAVSAPRSLPTSRWVGL